MRDTDDAELGTKANPLRVYDADAFYVRLSDIGKELADEVIDKLSFRFYNDSACEKCPYYADRHSDVCDECPQYHGRISMGRAQSMGDNTYLRIPAGDSNILETLLQVDHVKIIEKNKLIPMSTRIHFLGTLLEYQKPAVADLIYYERGILKSAPRTGKTVMAAAVVCKLGLKTIIVAAQRDWLVNFHETFVGSKTQEGMTDISQKKIGFAKHEEDFDKYDVCLCTYQTFISDKGQELLKRIRRKFSVLICDEVHRSSAAGHAKVVGQFACRYKLGLSGTPKRKDGKHIVGRHLFGPVIHQTDVARLKPHVEFHWTGTKCTASTWVGIVNKVEFDKKRQKMIAEMAIKDAKAGHMVLIPLARVRSIKEVTKLINEIAGETLAYEFYGALKKDIRDQRIAEARKYNIKILVGNIGLISVGINIPRASALYVVTPTSNIYNCEQRVSRILTPDKGKGQPLLRIFADDSGPARSCFRNEFFNCIHPMFKPSMSGDTYVKIKGWVNKKKGMDFTEQKIGGSF